MNKKTFFNLLVLISLSALLVISDPLVQPAAACPSCSEPTKIILVRHGQTHWNVLGILQGNANIPLDETGLEQAQTLAEEIAGKEVDEIYSSPLSRAYDTALAIAAPHEMRVRRRFTLREIGLGIYTGYQGSQIPEEVRTSWSTNPSFALPSGFPDTTDLLEPEYVEGRWFLGESLNMAMWRSWYAGIRFLAWRHCGENVIVVAHGGVIKIALTQVYGLPVTDYSTFDVPTASQTVLEFDPDGSVEVLPSW